MRGEPAPRRLSRAARVVDAADRQSSVGQRALPFGAQCLKAGHDMSRHSSKLEAPGGRTMLVRDDLQVFAFSRKPQDRAKKIIASCSVNPARPKYEVRNATRPQGHLSGEFAAAVDI